MDLRPEEITIAVTVYSRPQFVLDAVRSALHQTVPVKVVVVEDCGPDPRLRDLIVGEFGARIDYFRNPENRGLFDNWNACMEYCATPWISILHDDDLLHPWFVETMLGLTREASGRMLYFGRSAILDESGRRIAPPAVSWEKNRRDIDLVDFADSCFVVFPGQLFRIADARSVGGVRPIGYYTGDWDLWFRLALRGGIAQTATEVSVSRSHYGIDRGSSRVDRMGWKWALDNVQRKRNLHPRAPIDATCAWLLPAAAGVQRLAVCPEHSATSELCSPAMGRAFARPPSASRWLQVMEWKAASRRQPLLLVLHFQAPPGSGGKPKRGLFFRFGYDDQANLHSLWPLADTKSRGGMRLTGS